MTTGTLWIAMLFGLAIQFVVIYGAIRLALRDDRLAPAKAAAKEMAVTARKS